MPGVPFTCVSTGVVTVCSTVCASAPVKLPVICTVGGVISGYWLMGRFMIDNTPNNTITIEITIAVTGRLINKFAIIIFSLIRVWPLLYCIRFLLLISVHLLLLLFRLPATLLSQ